MLFRFCLYGFLKNQRYFEPFLMLALLEKGLNFFWIGLLISVREVTVNLLEIPSGAVADGWSRRISMILAFIGYIVSFLLFAFSSTFSMLVLAMVCFGVGDCFRTGTHKAMIFEWLRMQGREAERTEIYGYTRSWSQIGSALSGVLAAICVLFTANYQAIFLFATIPYVLNIINFLGYPTELDGKHERGGSFRGLASRALLSVVGSWRRPQLRRLMAESMGWEGYFNATRDYLQPAIAALALSWWLRASSTNRPESWLSEQGQTALLIGLIYPVLFLLSSAASRSSHRLEKSLGSLSLAARKLWGWQTLAYAALLIFDALGLAAGTVLAFVLLHVLMNVWRPILISRFDDLADAHEGATILSVESQSQRLATLFFAPLVGLLIDASRSGGLPGFLWPIGLVGVLVSGGIWGAKFRSARSNSAVRLEP